VSASPNEIAAAVRAERARCSGLVKRLWEEAVERKKKPGLGLSDQLHAEAAADVLYDVTLKLSEPPQDERLGFNVWQSQLSNLTGDVTHLESQAKTVEELALLKKIRELLSMRWNLARKLESGEAKENDPR